MNKQHLVQAIIEQLESKLLVAHSATQTAIDSATSEETVPEHKYDTLALEASYLAHGQAMRVQECEQELHQYKHLVLRDITARVGLSSLVTVADIEDVEKQFFIGPCAGGLSVSFAGKDVYVLTQDSPLGKALLGSELDDDIELTVGSQQFCYCIINIE